MDVPVLIVGAGPVGLSLAGDLAWRGIPSLIIEKGDGAIYQPKMDLVGVRTMEFCRRWGITDWVEASPYPRDYPQDNVYLTSLCGYELGRERMPSLADDQPPPQSPAKRERCPQDMFDPILRRFAESFDEVDLKYHHEFLFFHQTSGGVIATVRRPGGETTEISAQFVVGCDGASSVVRQGLGITMTGAGTLTYTTNVVFRSKELPQIHDKDRAYRFIFIDERGTYATLVAINGNDRWRFSIVGDREPRLWSRAEIDATILRAVGCDFEYEIESELPWVRRELVAESYGKGRVFIAGDSAHLTSPTGGLGMNTGIGDAVDLSWKLAAVLDGWGGSRLLDSYTTERRPVALRITKQSTSNLERMLGPRNLDLRYINADNAAGAQLRAEVGAQLSEGMKAEWHSLGLHLGIRYDNSPIIVPDGTPAPPSPVSSYAQTARPGARAPHAWIGPGRSTLDLFGRGFVLMRLGPEPPEVASFVSAARDLGVPVQTVELHDSTILELYEAPLVLVRPDGLIAWRGSEVPVSVRSVLDTVRGNARCIDQNQGSE